MLDYIVTELTVLDLLCKYILEEAMDTQTARRFHKVAEVDEQSKRILTSRSFMTGMSTSFVCEH